VTKEEVRTKKQKFIASFFWGQSGIDGESGVGITEWS
jgi:hypothetical protein